MFSLTDAFYTLSGFLIFMLYNFYISNKATKNTKHNIIIIAALVILVTAIVFIYQIFN